MALLYSSNLTEVPVNQMVSGDMPLCNAIAHLADSDIDCLLVIEAEWLQGWLTTKDVVKLAAEGKAGDDCALKMVMTQPPYVLNPEEARDLSLVLYYLQKYRVDQLPVVNDAGKVWGLVTAQQIMPLCSQQIDSLEKLQIQVDQLLDAQTNQDYLLREITDSVPGILYIYDLEEQRNIYSNKSIVETLGYTSLEIEDMGQEVFSNLIHPEDLPGILATAAIQKEIIHDNNTVLKTEYRMRRADGIYLWFSSYDRPFLRYPDGRPKQMIGVAQDITDRKQVEIELQASQHFLSSIIQAIPGIVYLHDLQTQRNIYMNDKGLEFLGYTREKIDESGSNFIQEIIHPEDLVEIVPLSIKDLAEGEVSQFEYRLKNTQGEWRWHLKQTMIFEFSPEGIPLQILGVIINIHDRKQTELELQSSQHFLQTIAETIPGILYIYDLQADRNIYVNSLAPEMLGYTKAQIDELGSNFLGQIIHPEDLATAYEQIMEQFATGAIARTEYRLKNAQGNWHWVLQQATVFQSSAEGIPQQLLGIVIDIHDHKLTEAALQNANMELENRVAERTQELWQTNLHLAHEMNEKIQLAETLRQREEFFRAIFQQAAVGINIATADGKLVKVNQKMCQMFGYTEAELLTMTWMDLTPPEFLTRGLEFTAKRHRGEIGDQQFEKQMICKDGSQLWVSMSVSLYRDPTTEMTYDLAITQDISDRKQMELDLHKSEARFQRMVANIPGMVYQFRCDLQGNYQITYANHYAQELYEISPVELMRDMNQCVTLTHPEDLERLNNAIIASFNTLQPWYWLGRTITPSGKLKWIEGNARPEKQANGDVIWDGIIMDVTDRKAIEAQIQANLQEKELLLKEIHHRVKNNLQIISSLLTLQSSNVTDQNILAMFQDSQTRIYAIALIHEKLYKTTQVEQINFAEYITNLVSYLHQIHISPQHSIQIQTNIAELLLNVETAIPCGLIISELVINALKYAFPQYISGQLITIELQRLDNQQLALSIKDNGIGIPNDCNLAEIDTLGLRLVKMLTQQLEGEITLTCNPGTQFVIVFHELKYSQRL